MNEPKQSWFSLEGKTALVTGGSRGIGREISVFLARHGAYVIVNFRSDDENAVETLRLISESGGKCCLKKFDVCDSNAVGSSLKEIIEERTSLEILVNNAGISQDGLLGRMSDSDWKTVIDTNLTGAFNMCRAVAKSMIRRRYGRIVNIASTAGETGNAGQVNYSAAKSGLIGLTKSLARELAPRNILVNCVSPGLISGGLSMRLSAVQVESIIQHVPLGRLGEPQDVAAAVAFFCSDMARYITGQVLRINGGLYM